MFARLSKSPTLLAGLLVAVGAGVAAAFIPGLDVRLVAVIAAAGAFVGGVVAMGGAAGGLSGSLASLRDAARAVTKGDRPARPSDVVGELADVYDALENVAVELRKTGDAPRVTMSGTGDDRTARAELEKLRREAEDLRAQLEAAGAGSGAGGSGGGDDAATRGRLKDVLSQIREAEKTLGEHVDKFSGEIGEQSAAVQQTTRAITDMTTSLREIGQHVEVLASSAEESSSSILEMTATNEEVAENMANLAASVRETVSSIEEMAYSIKEVARNVDELSLTAEETSSSMNEMDVSIDQVQSNANETARLSEEVAVDAEKGAEAILKTIAEINRIKDTSSDAVSVIANLGNRIEAIGDILSVIDDVAEQTNLLALNAAIIAAQAGEHGKGFAVVADEIKDLAERAGASTKEIADLIKTIQAESKNAIAAVERGAHTVDRGVEVSADAERALKKILESSQKSTNMVRAIARATVEQAKGSKQVTDAIGRIAETVQQIAAATAEQARGSELIMKSAEKMRVITQHVERSSQEQARGGKQITTAIESISNMVNQLHQSQRAQSRGSEQTLQASMRIQELTKVYEGHLRALSDVAERLRRLSGEG